MIDRASSIGRGSRSAIVTGKREKRKREKKESRKAEKQGEREKKESSKGKREKTLKNSKTYGEEVRDVVAERAVVGVLLDRHDLDRVIPGLLFFSKWKRDKKESKEEARR